MAERSIAALGEQLRAGAAIAARVSLYFEGVTVELESNRPEITGALTEYFAPFVTGAPAADAVSVRFCALELAEPELGLAFRPWPREPGKAQDKEQYADLADGRVVRKVRTGMQFLVGADGVLAVGPCSRHVNQLINVVNFALISNRLASGWALCHSAAVARAARGLAISGISGAGKSTLALWLLSAGYDYVSNDRVLVRRDGEQVRACGVPKHPRVNPGTLLADPALTSVLPESRRAELARLPAVELWALEEKYDVDVARTYGPGRIRAGATLRCFAVLTWRFGQREPCAIRETTFERSPHLLDAVMKLPGPFFRPAAGTAVETTHAAYLAQLSSVPVLELSGGVDFPRAIAACRERLGP